MDESLAANGDLERSRDGHLGPQAAAMGRPSHDDAQQTRASLDLGLDRLARLDLDDLRLHYRQLTRRTAPEHLPKWLLQRIIAYRIQAKAFGDLGPEAIQLLDQVARDQQRSRLALTAGGTGADSGERSPIPKVPPPPALARFKSGTVLMREHAGEMHEVTVLDAGYAWKGTVYRSLSEVARAITGTSWNGPRFFGLREAKHRTVPQPRNEAHRLTTGVAA